MMVLLAQHSILQTSMPSGLMLHLAQNSIHRRLCVHTTGCSLSLLLSMQTFWNQWRHLKTIKNDLHFSASGDGRTILSQLVHSSGNLLDTQRCCQFLITSWNGSISSGRCLVRHSRAADVLLTFEKNRLKKKFSSFQQQHMLLDDVISALRRFIHM